MPASFPHIACFGTLLAALLGSTHLAQAANTADVPAPMVSALPTPAPSPLIGTAPTTMSGAVPSAEATPAPSPNGAAAPPPAAASGLDANADRTSPIELPDLTLDKSGGITLTLPDSIRLAIGNATTVLKAENDQKINGAALLQSYGQFLPSVAVTSNYGYQTGNQYFTSAVPTYVNGSSLAAGYSIAATLNLFNGLADNSGLHASLLRKTAADLTTFRAKQAVALDVTQGFLQVVLDNRLVDIARKNLQESRARESLLTEQTRVGARNLADLFRQQALTSSDESLLLTSENKTRADQITFLRKIRVDVAKSYHFADPAVPEKPEEEKEGNGERRFADESTLLDTALRKRADLKATDQSASAASWDVESNWAGYLPKLNLTGAVSSGASYLYSQTVNGQSVVPPVQNTLTYQLGSQIEYSIGLYLTWNLFDRLLTHENVVRARAVADNASIDAEDFRNQVEGDVRQAYGNYLTSLAQLRSSSKGLQAAQKAYEVIEGRYEVGSASFIDLITAQAALLQAESARAQALIDFVLQTKGVEFAIGEIGTG